MAKIKLTKEEKLAQKAQKQQIRELWQSTGVKDIDGFNRLIDEMKTGTFPAPKIALQGQIYE